jgi:predicted N-acetyltransferase YhbS
MDKARVDVMGEEHQYLHLLHLSCLPEFQNQGLGSILLKACARLALELKMDVFLETNTGRLRGYYERHGFKVEAQYEIPDETNPQQENYAMVLRWKEIGLH